MNSNAIWIKVGNEVISTRKRKEFNRRVEQSGLARQVHTLEVTGSNPVSATIWNDDVKFSGKRREHT